MNVCGWVCYHYAYTVLQTIFLVSFFPLFGKDRGGERERQRMRAHDREMNVFRLLFITRCLYKLLSTIFVKN